MSRSSITIVVVLSAGIWGLVLIGHGWIVPLSFFTPVSIVVSALTIVLPLWDTWLWRLGLLHPWPVSLPDLRGTWRGVLTRTASEPITIFLVIEQTFSNVEIRTFTAESRSASMAARLARVEGQFLLASLYRNEPDLLLQDRSRTHRGAVWLWVHGPTPKELRGSYCTDRDTKGELRFEHASRRLASDHASAAALAAAALPAQANPSSLRSLPRETPSRRVASD